MLETLTLPFQFAFMHNAFLVGTLVALTTALLSPFLVLKGLALVGDAVAHAILPGLVLSLLFGIPAFVGALISGLLCIWVAGFLQTNTRIKSDTTLGVSFSGFFGLGLVLHASYSTGVDIHRIMLGDILGTNRREILEIGFVGLLVAIVVGLKWRDLMLYSFDPVQAKAIGLNINALHYMLLTLLVLCTIGSIAATGIVLAVAFLIAPGVISFMLTRRFGTMIGISILISLGSTFLGIYISFFLNSAPAPTIVLIMTIIFLIVFFFYYKTKNQLAHST